MPEIAPGTLVDGRYRVLERIGAGGMAEVYRAEDVHLGREVALKLLHRHFAEDEEFVERFRREASAAAGLQHPNVVGVYDRGSWDGTSYIAMEHLPGRSLKALIREEGPLDQLRAIDLALQILKAARFAHRHGVIHRDIKPHNVIVDDEGRAKVTDFGIARAGASDMTQTGSIMGTAQYLSPEQAQGHAVSAESDLYAVGVVLYEMLTGHVPFDGDTAVAIALKQVGEVPAPPSALGVHVAPALEQAVLRALEKDPARRFPDADAFIAALEQAREQIEGAATASGQSTAELAAVGAYAVAEGLDPAGYAGAAVPAAYAAQAYAPPEEPPAYGGGPPDGQEPRRRRRWPWVVLLVVLLAAAAAVAAYYLTRPVQVVVPDVVGHPAQSARAALAGDGFRVAQLARNSRKAKGLVLTQAPVGGARADKGSTVRIVVSSGPRTVTIPSVINEPHKKAAKALRKAGFHVKQVSQTSDSVPAGRVISTSPPAGTTYPVGQQITLTWSEGPQQVSVPDLTGQAKADAIQILSSQGLRLGSVTQQASRDAKPGTVIAQSPAKDATVPVGTAVDVTVAEQSAVRVPNVVGQSESDATNRLAAKGFSPNVRTQSVQRADQDGVVLSQDPQKGAKLDPGSQVTIVVGQYQGGGTTTTGTTTAPTSTTGTTTTGTTTAPAAGSGGG